MFCFISLWYICNYVFYQFSSSLKFHYLDIKKNFTKDNKYLATVTENGLWIKDNYDGKINFINSKNFLLIH